MADITISTSRQSCKPDCDQLNPIDQLTMNKYSEIDESPSTDTEEQGKSVESNAIDMPLNLRNMIENKLKRKKKLSTSLTSVSEAVNQEKRTRIEGIQLNCRGKLNEDLIAAATRSKSPSPAPQQQTQVRLERVLARTPQPSPKVAEKIILLQQQCHQQQRVQTQQQQQTQKVPPPRLKRKLEENISTIQKLNAQTEQMRLEIAELKTHLTAERGAVRVLRAQNESETRKWKNEVKKLQTAMELMRKVKKSKEEACANWPTANASSSLSSHGAKDATISNHELQRLTNEIKTLREANRTLEEKLQISNDAERRKAADLRELKDSYEIRLTQLSKSAKTEISRLLEEIKTKERNIGQLKKETQTLQKLKTNQTTNHNKKDTHPRNAAQHPIEMKKLKDIERNKNIINNNCNVTNKINTNNEKRFINTTCGEKEFHSMPHEITERILEAHNDVHAYGSKQDHQNSDSDSALSSAPPSISPQPPPTGMEPTDIWQTIRNYTKDIEKVQNELDSIRKENETLQKELKLAKIQIKESEKTALEATNTAKLQQQQHQQLQERIKYLEQRENELQEETHELREQNELLEFRILELEESNDKWSLQSNTTVNNKNVWSNSGKESDDTIIFTDRSDSGVTSPHSHHHIDDRMNAISPCDLNLLDHIRTDDLRRRLSQMIKKPNIDEDDRICLQQVLVFIQNLDVMSHDSLPSSEESSSLEYIKSRVSDYESSSRSSDVSPTLIVQKPKLAPSPAGRIVATVLPYSSTVSTPNESPQRKLRAWNTSSLTESGVFEGDLSESSVQTQTEPEDFACLEASNTKDLCSEIQKLNRFRERFEECFTKSAYTKVPVPSLPSLSPNLSDQKRIQFYKDRLDVLESKLLIYESSGDLQAKRLADRLQREIQLESLVKELRDRVDFLEVENAQLEEEKCEFEEAENDTRLRLQRLEVELEILSQRNIELEMSREALQNKLKDCRSESAILRDDLAASQTQICHLEEDRCRYKENFEFLHSAIPALVLFNVFCVTTNMGNTLETDDAPIAERFDHVPKAASNCDCTTKDQALRRESLNLREEVRSLKRQIGDLNSRHTEALACADGYWEDMERNYNEQLMASKAKEESLKQKIRQLEGCLEDDSRAANEKINQLEDAERELKYCLQRVSRDHREILKEHDLIREENQRLKEEYSKLKDRVEGPFKQAMEREKMQNKNLKEELGYMRRVSCEQEMHYRNELDCFQLQLDKLQKEFMQIQVTNSELKEEVCTLEKELVYLHEQKKDDLDKIRCLTDEVRTKEDMCALMEKRLEALLGAPYHTNKAGSFHPKVPQVNMVPSLAQELSGSPVKRIRMEEPKDLRTATKNLGAVLSCMKETTIPSHKQFQSVANDVKKLAETLLASKSSNVEVSEESEESQSYPGQAKVWHDGDSPISGEKPFDEIDNHNNFVPRPESRLIMFGTRATEAKEPLIEAKSTEIDEDMGHEKDRADTKTAIAEVPSDLRKIQSFTHRPKKQHKLPRKSLRNRFSQSLRQEIRRIISELDYDNGKFINTVNSDQEYPLEVIHDNSEFKNTANSDQDRPSEFLQDKGKFINTVSFDQDYPSQVLQDNVKFINTVSSDQDYPSEVFQRRLSLSSFHSVQDDEANDDDGNDDVFLETVNDEEFSTKTCSDTIADESELRLTDDQHSNQASDSTTVVVPKGNQISDSAEIPEALPPKSGENFVHALFESARKSIDKHDSITKIEMYVWQRFRNDDCFRGSLDKMVKIAYFGTENDKDDDCIFKLMTYDDVVAAMRCLAHIVEIYHPHQIPVRDRVRSTQNDCHRDHPNLSNQPNTEANAGQIQLSAGPNSNRHAKDNNTCYDNNFDDDEDEYEDDNWSGTDGSGGRGGQTIECEIAENGAFTDYCDGSCKPTKSGSTVKSSSSVTSHDDHSQLQADQQRDLQPIKEENPMLEPIIQISDVDREKEGSCSPSKCGNSVLTDYSGGYCIRDQTGEERKPTESGSTVKISFSATSHDDNSQPPVDQQPNLQPIKKGNPAHEPTIEISAVDREKEGSRSSFKCGNEACTVESGEYFCNSDDHPDDCGKSDRASTSIASKQPSEQTEIKIKEDHREIGDSSVCCESESKQVAHAEKDTPRLTKVPSSTDPRTTTSGAACSDRQANESLEESGRRIEAPAIVATCPIATDTPSQRERDYTYSQDDTCCMPQSLSKMLLTLRRRRRKCLINCEDAARVGQLRAEPCECSPQLSTDRSETTTQGMNAIQSAVERIPPLLERIYEVLQRMRYEKLQSTTAAVSVQEVETRKSNKPSSLQNGLRSVEEVCPVTEVPKPDNPRSWLSSGQFEVENVALLEPPERDMDRKSTSTPLRVIPVDMDLLRTEDNIDWEILQSVENNPVQDDLSFAVSEAEAYLKGTEWFTNNEVQVGLAGESSLCQGVQIKVDDDIKPKTAEVLHFPYENPHGGRFERKFSKEARSEAENVFRTARSIVKISSESPAKTSSESVLGESTRDVQMYSKGAYSQLPLSTTTKVADPQKDQKALCKDVCTFAEDIPERDDTTAPQPSTAQFLLSPTEEDNVKKLEKPEKLEETPCLPPIKSNVGTDRPDFANEPCSCSGSYKNRQADNNIVDTIIEDLEAMQAVRSTVKYKFSNISSNRNRWRAASTDLSFPATIETVQELGPNSLFVKWKVYNLKNVAGYEIFLDGTLTNRYYSPIHRAVVICNVNLEYPHRIILRALPQSDKRFSPSTKSSITSKDTLLATTTPGACGPQISGTLWYPSVYHFEPTLPSTSFFRL